MNKKVIIWGAVAVGAILLYRHMKATKAAELAKQAVANESSNAIGNGQTLQCSGSMATNENCQKACQKMGGSYDSGTKTCSGITGAPIPPYGRGMARSERY